MAILPSLAREGSPAPRTASGFPVSGVCIMQTVSYSDVAEIGSSRTEKGTDMKRLAVFGMLSAMLAFTAMAAFAVSTSPPGTDTEYIAMDLDHAAPFGILSVTDVGDIAVMSTDPGVPRSVAALPSAALSAGHIGRTLIEQPHRYPRALAVPWRS